MARETFCYWLKKWFNIWINGLHFAELRHLFLSMFSSCLEALIILPTFSVSPPLIGTSLWLQWPTFPPSSVLGENHFNQIWQTAVTRLSFYCLLKNILFSARNPNPSRLWAESVLPQWPRVVSSDPSLIYLELSPTLKHNRGLSQRSCSFWNHLASRLTNTSSESHHASRHFTKIKPQLEL